MSRKLWVLGFAVVMLLIFSSLSYKFHQSGKSAADTPIAEPAHGSLSTACKSFDSVGPARSCDQDSEVLEGCSLDGLQVDGETRVNTESTELPTNQTDGSPSDSSNTPGQTSPNLEDENGSKNAGDVLRKPDHSIGGTKGKVVDGMAMKVAMSPTGTRVAASAPGLVSVFTDDSDKPVWTYKTGSAGFSAVCFSPDGGSLAASGTGGGVALLRSSDGRVIWESNSNDDWHAVQHLVFDNSGETLYAGWGDEKGRFIAQYEVETGTSKMLASLGGNRWILGMQWLLVEQKLLIIADKGLARIIDPLAPAENPTELTLPDSVADLAFSKDERSFVHFSEAAMIRSSWPSGDELSRVAIPEGTKAWGTKSIEGDRVIVNMMSKSGDSIQIWDTVGLKVLHRHVHAGIQSICTNRKKSVATILDDGRIVFWNLVGDTLERVNPDLSDPYSWVVWGGDRDSLIVAEQSGRVSRRDVKTGTESYRYETPNFSTQRFVLSPSGDMLLLFGLDDAVSIWSAETGTNSLLPAKIWSGPGGWSAFPGLGHFSSDGGSIYIGTTDGIHEYDTTSLEKIRTLVAIKDYSCFRVSPDGDRVAIAVKSELRIYAVGSNEEPSVLPKIDCETWSIRWSPDGDYLGILTNNDSELLLIWNTNQYTLRAKVKTSSLVESFTFGPTGKEFTTISAHNIVTRYDMDGRMLEELSPGQDRSGYLTINPGGRCLEYSPDGKTILCVFSGEAVFWDIE